MDSQSWSYRIEWMGRVYVGHRPTAASALNDRIQKINQLRESSPKPPRTVAIRGA